VKVALAQFAAAPGDAGRNAARMAALVADAARAGARLVLFPEMSDTAYAPSLFEAKASAWDAPPLAALRAAARDHRVAVLAGLSEKAEGRVFNSLAAIGPDGALLGRYRKAHLIPLEPNREPQRFGAGADLLVLPLGGMSFGLSICYDLRFPELYRALMLRGAEVLVNVAAWPVVRAPAWEILARARAVENQAWFLGANGVGAPDSVPQAGRSCVVDPLGEVVAMASPDREELLFAEVSPDAVRNARKALPARASRRPDLYGDVTRPDPPP
jgi:predicted amidohydrolase